RSNSLDTKHQTNESVDEEDDNDRIDTEKSKKKLAFIRDENGVCRPESLRNVDMEHKEREEEEDNNTIQNDEFYTNRKTKELGKEFTLKDILGHRVPELEIDNIKDDEDMGHNE
ncbi:unnamed protein product, partial [Schistosoma rodhaini]|uniref:Uncharacterized protein n=1 Tax=Schistosoma rodhaini TaxID=6188 RepID=A0AA85GBH3_9TREM